MSDSASKSPTPIQPELKDLERSDHGPIELSDAAADAVRGGTFEINDFSFGVENPTTIGSATGGAGAGKIKFSP